MNPNEAINPSNEPLTQAPVPTPPPAVMPAAPQPSVPPAAPIEYHSNPFAVNIVGLMRILEVNGLSGLMLSFLMYVAILLGYLLAIGLIFALAQSAGMLVSIIIVILALVLIVIFSGALFALITKSVQGQSASASELLGDGIKKFLPMLALAIMVGVITTIGFIFLIVPGLILIGRLALAPYALMFENLGPIAALKRSMQLTKGHVFEVYGAMLAGVLFSSQGLLSPLTSVNALGARFYELKKLQESGAPRHPTHWLNFLVTLFVPLLIGGLIGASILMGSMGDPEAEFKLDSSGSTEFNSSTNSDY